MDSKIVALQKVQKQQELMYQNECRQQYQDFLVDTAYADQEKRRKEAPPSTPPEMIHAIIKYREWYSLKCSGKELTDTMNCIETMGFPIVHIVPGYGGEYMVTGCRVVNRALPEKRIDTGEVEELPPVDNEPPVLGDADENARKEWENATD